MKSFTGKFSSARGWVLLTALLFGAGIMISACGDEEVPAPTTPTPAPAPTPAPTPPPEPEPTGPAAPENLRASASTHNSITWTWDAVENVIGYQGQFSPDSEFTDADQTFLIVAPQTSHTVSNLSGNTTGYFRVRSGTGTSLTDLTYSDWTDGVSGTTAAPPSATPFDAPGGFSAGTATDDSIPLSWDEVDDAEEYEVQLRVAGAGGNWDAADCGGDGTNIVDGTSCVAEGLAEGTNYEFRVRALPASDDTVNAIGEWAETDGSTTGRTAVTTPGGMGDLDVTWKSDANSITFSWQPMSGVDYEWEVMDAFNDDPDPCEDEEYTTTGQNGARFNHEVPGLSPGDVRGLCVRIMDDDLNDDEKGLSFAWAAVTPAAPTPGTPVDEDGVTDSMTWTAINLIPDFEWELRLVEDQGRNDGSIEDTSSASDVQKACAAGDHIDDGEADLNLVLSHTKTSGIVHYAGYSLCLKYSNTTGSTNWAVHDDEVYTTPGTPQSPVHQNGRKVTVRDANDVRQTETLTWTVDTTSSAATRIVPREADEYEAKIITYPQYFEDSGTRTQTDHPSSQSHCDLSGSDQGEQQQWDFEAVTLATANNDLDGFNFSSSALPVPANDAESLVVRVCVRATEGSKVGVVRNGPWRIGGGYTVPKNPAP